MRCPFCKQNIRIQGRFCPRCGEQIFGLPVGRPGGAPTSSPTVPPPASPPAYRGGSSAPDMVDVDIDFGGDAPAPPPRHPDPAPLRSTGSAAQAASADDEYIGKMCPYCRFPIKPGERIIVCPECRVPHHEDCWHENQSCTTYGCTGGTPASQSYARGGQSPSSDGGWSVGGPPRPHPPLAAPTQARVESTFLDHRARELESRANNALVLSVLGFLCFVPALIGFFMGVSVLGQVAQTRALANSPARGRALAAVIIGLFFTIGGVLALWVVPALSGGSSG